MTTRLGYVLGLALLLSAPPRGAADAGQPRTRFFNPIGEGADPWVVRDAAGGRYLWCMSDGNRAIAIHASAGLTAMGRKHIVWRAPASGPVSREVWAPELHFLDGRWHIYFAASDGRNENHLAYVLRSRTADPLGGYDLHGPFATGDGADGRSPNVWAIDMTVLERGGRRYALWSGWDAPGSDRQYLYIAPMKSPLELAGPRVRLCRNDDFEWERTEPGPGGRGLNEGPQILQRGTRTFVVYSCGASWLPNYKLGLLELTGSDPLSAAAWRKHPKPVFEGTEKTYGVGHSCFVPSPDGREWWHVYHAKRSRDPGWQRAVFVQPLRFDKTGFPDFGTPVPAGEPLPRPSGETDAAPVRLPFKSPMNNERDLDGWTYYGHHQFAGVEADGLHLGRPPAAPINDYRCGEKVVLDGPAPDDVAAEVTVHFAGNSQSRDAGLLFRVSGLAIGYDAQRGYFAGLIPRDRRVILGRTDGERWRELARADADIDAAKPHRLRIEAVRDRLVVRLDGAQVIAATDGTYTAGACGLRVVDAQVVFSDFSLTTPE